MNDHLLLAYSWGFGHVGDVAIAPGMLRAIGKHQPGLPIHILDIQPEHHPRQPDAEAYLRQYAPGCRVFPNVFQRLLQADRPESAAMRGFVARWGEQAMAGFERGRLSAYESEAMAEDLLERFPLELAADLRRERPDIADSFERAGFVLYNSSTALSFGRLGVRHIWRRTLLRAMPLLLARALQLPYGLYAQSFEALDWPIGLVYKRLLAEAKFVYCRDSDSLELLRQKGLLNRASGFRPDSTFFFEGRDDRWADEWMRRHDLQENRFISLMVRIAAARPGEGADPIAGSFDAERLARHMDINARFIERWVAATGMKVLICHEAPDTIDSARTHLWSRLSRETRERCVYMDHFWTTEQAYTIYRRSRMLVSMEIHSVFLALNAGTPVVHHPFAEAGRKMEMMRDVGLGDWLVDIDTCTEDELLDKALTIHHHESEARRRIGGLLPALQRSAGVLLDEIRMHWRKAI